VFGIASLLTSVGVDLVGRLIDSGEDKAIEFVKDKTGIDLSKKSELSKDEIEKLKKFENENKKLILEKTKMFLKDMENARNMQVVALNQDDLFSKRFIYYFAMVWSVFAMLYMTAITFYDIPKDSIRFADTIQGFLLGTIVAQIIAFFYGSSIGSKQKTEALERGAKKWI